MSELPQTETDDARDMDHGEVFRKSPKHLEPGPLPVRDKKILYGVLAAGAALAALVFTLAK